MDPYKKEDLNVSQLLGKRRRPVVQVAPKTVSVPKVVTGPVESSKLFAQTTAYDFKCPLWNPKSPFYEDISYDDIYGTLQSYFKGRGGKPLLLVGPPGCGKTYAVLHFAKGLLDYFDDCEMADFLRTSSLTDLPTAYIDRIEALTTEQRAVLRDCIRAKKHRKLILTTDDANEEPAKGLLKDLCVVKFEKPTDAWLLRVVKVHAPSMPDSLQKQLVNACNQNVASLLNILDFVTKDTSIQFDASTMVMDTYADVPKRVYQYLYGTAKERPTSDVSFLNTMLLCNVSQSCKTMDQLTFAMDHLTCVDLFDYSLDDETKGTIVHETMERCPKLSKQAKWFPLQWPKSVKPLERPTMNIDTISNAIK
jgi:hypothetical protein